MATTVTLEASFIDHRRCPAARSAAKKRCPEDASEARPAALLSGRFEAALR